MKKIMVGFVAGVATGMLFTPVSGQQLRTRIVDLVLFVPRKINATYTKLYTELTEKVENTAEAIDHGMEKFIS